MPRARWAPPEALGSRATGMVVRVGDSPRTVIAPFSGAPFGDGAAAPATVLAVPLAVSPAWAAATVAGALPFAWLAALGLAWTAELAALYAVGAHGPARATWPAPVAVGVAGGAVLGFAVASDPAESAGPGTVALLTALGLVTVPWLLPVWGLGLLTRARRGDGGRWERRVLDAMAVRVGEAVTDERHRVATGLHGTVVEHTARLVSRAEAGLSTPEDRRAALAAMTAAARGALAGLRDLLDAMDAARLPNSHPPRPRDRLGGIPDSTTAPPPGDRPEAPGRGRARHR
ncbi:hypothetical protein [Streptomyces spectabilis]|uniref:Histidine kinase n=1 Tax=Streptomyces spectabilis TaxID=68270 RepID=A0A516R2Q5_STRST|nr:hypothetical protein [Streptomyces spectabilis]QDQ09939.1 hypothetical protein FH965_04670 [Streptomyces spectabilis]